MVSTGNYTENNYDDEPLCDNCYEREWNVKYLHDYGYKLDPIFRGSGKCFFGAELEIDRGGKDEDNACELCEEANRHCENIYNGVIYNDKDLRKSEKLPKTNIQTDSYIAVQFIENKRTLNFGTLKFMAEKVMGYFCFTLLDKYNNFYII